MYRNGPGKMEAGGTPLGHIFDGDGMLTMYSMAEGKVHFRNRFIQTKHYQRSIISDGAPFRALGTMREGGLLANAFRFPANVLPIDWRGARSASHSPTWGSSSAAI